MPNNHHNRAAPRSTPLLTLASFPLLPLDPTGRIAMADHMRKILRPPVNTRNTRNAFFKGKAVAAFWAAVADHARVAQRINREGETSALLAELAHLNRRAFSALTAVRGITLGDLYPVPLAFLADFDPEGSDTAPASRPSSAVPIIVLEPFPSSPIGAASAIDPGIIGRPTPGLVPAGGATPL